ncbi:MAG: NAD(P)-dependent oxidoreductase [Bacteroidia bacterium]
MNILIVGAMGRAGKLLTEYALEAGHSVTAFSRSVDKASLTHPNLRYVKGDVLYPMLLEAVMPGHDAVISVLGVRNFSGPITLLSEGMEHIEHVMKNAGVKRVLTISGAGILQQTDTRLRRDDPSFPPYLHNITADHYRVYDILRHSKLDWTIVTPPYMPDGTRTGEYLVEADYFPENARNEIAVEDVADFLLKEVEENKFLGKRVGIAYRS